MTTVLSDFFNLAGHEKDLHPLAVKNFGQFLDDIRKGVPLDELTDEDMKAFLSDWDYQRYQDGVKSLQEWLGKCWLTNSDSAPSVYPGSFPTWGTFWLKSLLSKASKAKHAQEMIAAARKEREAEVMRARHECKQYIIEIDSSVTKFKHDLELEKKPKLAYPSALATHKPNSWCALDSPEEGMVREWAKPRISGRTPEALNGLLSCDLTMEVLHMPYCKYAQIGVPCLVWQFKRTLLVGVRIRVATAGFIRTFRGYESHLNLTPEDLGCLWLGPVWWDNEEGFATPVALLSLLAAGELEAPGISILSHDGVSTVYTIEGYDEHSVEVSNNFVNFIRTVSKNQPLPQALLSLGLIDNDTDKLLEKKGKVALPAAGNHAVAGGCDPTKVITKLTELGWSEADAKQSVAEISFPFSGSTEELVKVIMAKCHGDSGHS